VLVVLQLLPPPTCHQQLQALLQKVEFPFIFVEAGGLGDGLYMYWYVCMQTTPINSQNEEEFVLLLHLGTTLLHSRLLPELSYENIQSHE